MQLPYYTRVIWAAGPNVKMEITDSQGFMFFHLFSAELIHEGVGCSSGETHSVWIMYFPAPQGKREWQDEKLWMKSKKKAVFYHFTFCLTKERPIMRKHEPFILGFCPYLVVHSMHSFQSVEVCLRLEMVATSMLTVWNGFLCTHITLYSVHVFFSYSLILRSILLTVVKKTNNRSVYNGWVQWLHVWFVGHTGESPSRCGFCWCAYTCINCSITCTIYEAS